MSSHPTYRHAQLKHKTRTSGPGSVGVMFRLFAERGWQWISIAVAEQSPFRTEEFADRQLLPATTTSFTMHNQLRATGVGDSCIPRARDVFNKSSTSRNNYRRQGSSTIEESATETSVLTAAAWTCQQAVFSSAANHNGVGPNFTLYLLGRWIDRM